MLTCLQNITLIREYNASTCSHAVDVITFVIISFWLKQCLLVCKKTTRPVFNVSICTSAVDVIAFAFISFWFKLCLLVCEKTTWPISHEVVQSYRPILAEQYNAQAFAARRNNTNIANSTGQNIKYTTTGKTAAWRAFTQLKLKWNLCQIKQRH